MPSTNHAEFIRVASTLDTMGLHDHADEVMALAATERAASLGLPHVTSEDNSILDELKQFRFAVKHLYAPTDEVERAYKESVLFRLDKAIEARERASNVRLAQVEEQPTVAPAQPANPFEVFVKHGLGELTKNLVRAEAAKFAAKNKKKVPEAEMVQAAKANLDSFIKAAMTADNVRRLVNMALNHVKEEGSPEEFALAKQELSAAGNAIVQAAQGGYAAAKAAFPEVSKVWPANFTLNVLMTKAPTHEQVMQKDPRHRENLEDHFEDAPVAGPTPAEETEATQETGLPEALEEPPAEDWPAIPADAEEHEPQQQQSGGVPETETEVAPDARIQPGAEIANAIGDEGLDDLSPITVTEDGQSAVAEEADHTGDMAAQLIDFLETMPNWREEILAAPSAFEYLNGVLGGGLDEIGPDAHAVAEKVLEAAQSKAPARIEDEPEESAEGQSGLQGLDHIDFQGEDPYGLYARPGKFFRHPDMWPVTHSNIRGLGGLTVVPSHAYSLLTSHMPELHQKVLEAPSVEARRQIVADAAAHLLGGFRDYLGRLKGLIDEGRIPRKGRRASDAAKLANIIRQDEAGSPVHWPQIVEMAMEYVSQPDLPEAPPQPGDHVSRSVSPVPEDLSIKTTPQHGQPSKSIWEDHPSALQAYERDHGLPPGAGGALVPDAKPAAAPASSPVPAWKQRLRGVLDSLRNPKVAIPAAIGLGAIGLGLSGGLGGDEPAVKAPSAPVTMSTQDVNEGLADLSSRMPPSQVGTADRVERLNPARVAPPVQKPSRYDWLSQMEYESNK